MHRLYVSDTNIWIDFHNADLLDELFRLPFTFCSTDFVLDELQELAHEELTRRGLIVERLDGAAISVLIGLTSQHRNSSLADVSCYFLAREHALPLLTGDGRLRRQALRDGLPVHGALWLMDQLLAHGVTPVERLHAGLESMLQAGARLPAEECQRRLKEWRAPSSTS